MDVSSNRFTHTASYLHQSKHRLPIAAVFLKLKGRLDSVDQTVLFRVLSERYARKVHKSRGVVVYDRVRAHGELSSSFGATGSVQKECLEMDEVVKDA